MTNSCHIGPLLDVHTNGEKDARVKLLLGLIKQYQRARTTN
jgi:hypothetical protein